MLAVFGGLLLATYVALILFGAWCSAIAAGHGPQVTRVNPRGKQMIYRPHLDAWLAAGGAHTIAAPVPVDDCDVPGDEVAAS